MKKILLVEDESLITLSEKQLLEKNGFSVKTANSGEKALESFDDVDIVLMDINLGSGIDGTEAAKQILSRKEVPIIFLSSHTEKEFVEKAQDISNYGYVVKNSGEFVLIESIRMALNLFEAQQKDRRFKSIFHDSITPMFIINPNDNSIVDANLAATKLYDYSISEFQKMRILDINTLDEETIKQEIELAKRHERSYFSFIHKRKDGSPIPVEVYSGPVRVDTDEYLYSIVHDISHRERISQRFSNLFDKMTEGVAIYTTPDDGETFIIQDINPAGLKKTNLKLCDAINKNVEEVFPNINSDSFRLLDVFKQVYETGETIDHPVSHYEGENLVSWFENRVFKLDTDEVVAIYSDVTKKKVAEEKLKKSREGLQTILDSIGDGVISVDRNKLIESVNPVAEQLIGCCEFDCIGRKMEEVFNIINSKTNEVVANPIDLVLETGDVQYLANHVKLVSQDWIEYHITDSAAPMYDENGNIKGVVFVFRDISEEYKKNQKIKESERNLAKFRERLGAVMRMGDIAWWEFDVSDGSVIFNENKALMLGRDPDEIHYHKDFMELIPQSDRDYILEERRKLLNQELLIYDVEYRVQHVDGHYVWFHDIGKVIEWKQGEPKKVTGVTINISKSRKRETEYKDLAEEKEKLMNELNHRVKNNLAIVKSYVQIKNLETEDDLNDIIYQIQSIITLHEKLYNSENGENISFEEYVQSLLENIFSTIPHKNISINLDIDSSIKFDSKKTVNLGLVINETATNAIKYGFNGGGEFKVSLQKGEYYNLEIENNGNKFSNEFDLENSSGTGLNLIKTIVSDMSGEIKLYKEPYTKFVIKFP